MSPEDVVIWELDLVPNGNLVLILTNLDAYEGDSLAVFDYALASKGEGSIQTLAQITEYAGRDDIPVQRPKARNRTPKPLWESDSIRAKLAPIGETASSIRVRIAAEHFSHVSSVFELFMKPTGETGNALLETGHAELPLPDDDAAAMITILLVLFNMQQEVNSVVSVPLLCSICVLIDKYGLHAPLSLHTRLWYEEIENSFDSIWKSNAETIHWLCILHVLGKKESFDIIAGSAWLYAQGALHAEMTPIPQETLNVIEQRRVQAITDLRSMFDEEIERYKSGGELVCAADNFACDALNLGVLVLHKSRSDVFFNNEPEEEKAVQESIIAIEWMEWPQLPVKQGTCCGTLKGRISRKLRQIKGEPEMEPGPVSW